MDHYKVYLSSTFRDLKDHRKAILKLFSHISNDFSISAMEGYTAENISPLEKVIADVKQCDIYILLLANRYGHIPANNDLNPHRRSITQIEYDTAMESKKHVFVYLAEVHSDTIKFMEDDDNDEREYKREMLTKFRNSVSEIHLSPDAFSTTEDLLTKISASIILLARANPSVGFTKLNENLKYCCDRSEQFTTYEQNMKSGTSLFHVFVTYGHENDSGGNLANRCAIFTLNLSEEQILPLSFGEFYYSDSIEENRQKFIYQLHKLLRPESDISTSSLEELKNAIKDKKTTNIVIRINCYEEFLDEAKIKFLANMFGDLHSICSAMYDEFKKRIYFFLNIEDNYEDAELIRKTESKINLLKQQAGSYHMNFVPLSRFKLGNREHINNWIEKYITKDLEKRDELYEKHFSEDIKGSFRLRAAEKSIRRLCMRIINSDPNIINLFNSKI